MSSVLRPLIVLKGAAPAAYTTQGRVVFSWPSASGQLVQFPSMLTKKLPVVAEC